MRSIISFKVVHGTYPHFAFFVFIVCETSTLTFSNSPVASSKGYYTKTRFSSINHTYKELILFIFFIQI
ncbi:MAG: hypothetical protein QXU18_13795, partial [Thermoplasmatales archaeon]